MKVEVKKVQGQTEYSAETFEYMQEAADFAFRQLGIDGEHTVMVGLCDEIGNIEEYHKSENYKTVGVHYLLDADYSLIYVAMKNRTLNECLGTLFHEMTHVKQFSKKECVRHMGVWHWKGKIFLDADEHEEYKNYPWEVEARMKSSEILDDWTIYRAKMWFKNLWWKSKFWLAMALFFYIIAL